MAWTECSENRPFAAQRLICFPHAGGSSFFFREWRKGLPEFEVHAVCYPGRADRFGEPVATDLVAMAEEIALGPTLLGRYAPMAGHWLFPKDTLPMLDGLAQIGLIFFMFGVGRELTGMRLRGNGPQALLVSKSSLLLPFAAGTAAAVPLVHDFLGRSADPMAFVLFVGCALSVTAFPVLARILTDLGITGTRQGQLSLFAAPAVRATRPRWCCSPSGSPRRPR